MFKLKKLAIVLFPLNLLAVNVHAGSTDLVTVSSPGLPLIQKATKIRAMAPNTPVEFMVWLKLRNKNKLEQLTQELYDPNSPNYQKFLTSDEYRQQYAPTEVDENLVKDYFIAQGMDATIVNHGVRVKATAQQVEQALHVRMNYYEFNHKTGYANSVAPTLSPEIAAKVSGIFGLNKLPRFRPYSHSATVNGKLHKAHKPHDLHFIWDSFMPANQPTTNSLNGISGAHLQTAYNIAGIAPINGTPIDGTGQTIVIVDSCDTNSTAQIMADANLFNSNNGIAQLTSTNFKVINANGSDYTTCGTSGNTGWNTEIALDVESAHALAPQAKIVLVLSDSSNDLDFTEISVINTLMSNNNTIPAVNGFNNAHVISNSWGGFETDVFDTALETSLLSAIGAGISVNFSSGDCGDNAYSGTACTAFSGSPTVNYPSSSAYVTSVGGSSLFVDSNWNYSFETGWGTRFPGGFHFGAGGGISTLVAPPSWQASISTYTAGGYSGTVGSHNGRATPDLALLADPFTGLIIYEGGSSFAEGGTSLACPLFSASLALVNQARALLNKTTPIGQGAPYLYNSHLAMMQTKSINPIVPPHQIISGATTVPGGPLSAFTISSITYGWNSSLTITPETQFWNDAGGVGSPNLPNFVSLMANM